MFEIQNRSNPKRFGAALNLVLDLQSQRRAKDGTIDSPTFKHVERVICF